MKIESSNNKVFYKNGTSSEEIHPFWLRERANGEKHLDKGTQQRLFDPTSLDVEVQIKEAQIKDQILEINFNDGVNSKLDINLIAQEFSKKDIAVHSIEKIKWDSSLKSIKNFEFKDDLFESEEMYNILVSFYKYGFVIIKKVPTEDNYLVKFANSAIDISDGLFGDLCKLINTSKLYFRLDLKKIPISSKLNNYLIQTNLIGISLILVSIVFFTILIFVIFGTIKNFPKNTVKP